jgi:O-antigen ligase
MDNFIAGYERVLFFFIMIAVALLGTGGFELFRSSAGISAWSVSRTTFFFWVLWKLLIAFRYKRWEINFFKHPIPFALLLFLFIVAISLLPDFHQSGDFRYFSFGCAHAVMVMDLCRDQRRSRWILLLLALAPVLLVFRGIIGDPALLRLDQMRRFGFPLDHANTAGYFFSMSLPFAVSMTLTREGLLRGLAIFSTAVQTLGLVLTYSRGAWLGGIVALAFLGVTQKSWRIAACVLIPLVLVFSFAKPLRDRVLTFADPQADIAVSDRIRVMKGAVRLGIEHPILGIGYGRGRLKKALRDTYKGTANENTPIWHAHNVYVELFAETGVLGLGAFLWLLGRSAFETLCRAYRAKSQSRTLLFGLAGAWIGAAVTGLSDIPFYHHETRIFFFTILALAFCLSDRPGDHQE